MKKKFDPYKPLDKYEEELAKAIENDEFVSVPNPEKEIARLTSYFKNFPKKDKRITIRVKEKHLEKIQEKAIQTGIPYQTIIGSLISQYATGKISLKI
jgi:predicted DNA binding CopG/RHH family protein